METVWKNREADKAWVCKWGRGGELRTRVVVGMGRRAWKEGDVEWR